MTGFCTTIDLISKRIREVLQQDANAKSEIAALAQRIAGEFDITLGTATWIVRNVVRNYCAAEPKFEPTAVAVNLEPDLELAEA